MNPSVYRALGQAAANGTLDPIEAAKIVGPEMAYLMQNIHLLDPVSATALKNGEMQLRDKVHYKNAQIQLGANDFWNESNTKSVGQSSLDKNYLPDRENMVVTGISIAFGQHASVTNPGNIAYSQTYDVDGTSFASNFTPAAFANGELEIRWDDKPTLIIPIYEMLVSSPESTAITGLKPRVFALRNMQLLKANQNFYVRVISSTGTVTALTGNHFAKVQLHGSVILPR